VPSRRCRAVGLAGLAEAGGDRWSRFAQPRVLYQVRSGSRNAGIFFRFFSADPSRRHFILDAGTSNARVNGWIDHGKLVPLTPADGNAPIYEAW